MKLGNRYLCACASRRMTNSRRFYFTGKVATMITRVLVAGGSALSNNQKCLKDFEIISIEKSVDLSYFARNLFFSELKTSRRGATLIALSQLNEEKLFGVVGGCSGGETNMDSAEFISFCGENGKNDDLLVPNLIEHIEITVMGHGRSCAATAFVNNDWYIFGGWDGRDCLETVEKLNLPQSIESPSESLTRKLSSLSFPVKNAAAFNVKDSSVTFCGGWDGKRTLDLIYKFNVSTAETILVCRLPYPVECHAVVCRGDKCYVFGGFDGIQIHSDIIVYDCATNEAHILPDVCLKVARECHAAVLTPDEKYIIVLGGWDGTAALKSVEIFEFKQEAVTDNDGANHNLKHVGYIADGLQVARNRLACAIFD